MNRIFSPDNTFFRALARCVDLVGLSMLWVLLLFPVVTIAPSTAALYHAVCRVFYFHEEDGAFGLFFRSLRANLKQGVLVSLIFLPVVALLIFLYWIYSLALENELPGATAAYVFFLVLLIIPVGLVCWVLPMLGRFQFTLPDLFLTAFRLIFAHIPTTLALVVLTVLLYSLATWWMIFTFLAPALWAVCAAPLLERAFARHMEADEEPDEGADSPD